MLKIIIIVYYCLFILTMENEQSVICCQPKHILNIVTANIVNVHVNISTLMYFVIGDEAYFSF